jgi:hypothetical protein
MGSFPLRKRASTFTTTIKECRMKHFADLKTLSVAAFVAAMAPAAAMAQIQTYYHAGVWDAFSGRNDKGGAVCGIGNTNPSDNRRVSIRFDIGGTDTVLSASKPDWSIPDGTRVAVVTQIGLNTPWTEQGTGQGHSISWVLDPNGMRSFDQQFRGASLMTLTFPDGNEPPWSVPLIGSSAISQTFARCITDLTRQVQAAQAAGAGAAPVPQGATQPFAAGAQSAPDAAAPAPQPTGAQPTGGAQPSGTQPTGATQPTGTQPTH